ncbi:MAG: helix-turn-helix transcriptional regulator [Dehalococcoidia bacterium]|nr:helix-turn-helix transcriptional regulator [Dehalococcoidia bacterium]
MRNLHHSRDNKHSRCGPPSGRMLGFIQPWLLLLLSEESAHGYQLLDKLNQNEDTRGIDPGFLYRTLRQFEEDGLVKSSWDMEGRGPARRVYEVTADGIEYLHSWVGHIRSNRARLGRFLETYESCFG